METSPEKSRSKYVFELLESMDASLPDYIHIIDLCEEYCTMSVTNNAENVIKEVAGLMSIEGRVITYVDSDGQIDRLLHDGKKFTGFKAGTGL